MLFCFFVGCTYDVKCACLNCVGGGKTQLLFLSFIIKALFMIFFTLDLFSR